MATLSTPAWPRTVRMSEIPRRTAHGEPMDLGYARVSTAYGRQSTALQLDALTRAGVDRVWQDLCSGAVPAEERDQFSRLMEVAREGDTIHVWALDRLGRSASSTLRTIEDLADRGIGVRVLKDGLNTSGATGKLIVTILAAVAEMERAFILERSREGMASARARGVHMGRPASLNAAQREHARELHAAGESYSQIAALLGTSKGTAHRAVTSTG